MFFRRLPYIIYRDYPNFGYLTDNRNFGYDTASRSCIKVGDRILSKTGSMFYSYLSETFQSLQAISEQVSHRFRDVPFNQIEEDAKDFFHELAKDGFIDFGEDVDSGIRCNYFSYADKRTNQFVEDVESLEEPELKVDWGTEYRLSRVHVDVSGLCNERCVHCYFPEEYRNRTMPLALFKEVLNQSSECKVLNITISGGEPMLNPNLIEFIELCRDGNYSINLLSNLTLLTDDLVSAFERTPLLSVQTSLYSMDGDTHDSITTSRGSFAKTKRAIEILHEHNIPMQINCPVMKQNKDTYQDVLRWASSLNIEASSDYMLFGCFDGSRKNLQCRLDAYEIESIIKQEREYDSQGIRRKILSKSCDEESHICSVCTNSLCVSNSGNVYPCEGWQSCDLGNINKTRLSRVWTESSLVKQLRNLTYKDFPKCLSCEAKQYCSICLIRNVNESDNLNYMDVNPFFCDVARKKMDIINAKY